jgi:hypothetical protein
VQRNHTHSPSPAFRRIAVYVGRSKLREPIWGWHTLQAWRNNDFNMDMAWYMDFQWYMVGMFYALNHEAVRLLLALGPTDISGDEDQRMGYWMQALGVERMDMGSRFHDHHEFVSWPWREHWRAPITDRSLAVHQCKTTRQLESAIQLQCFLWQDHLSPSSF